MTGVGILKKILLVASALLALSTAAQAETWHGKASYYKARGVMTCAHRFLPFGTRVRVTNLMNHRSAVLVVNDRGPFIRGRIVDVSMQAANVLGLRHAGVAPVILERL
jgi:rare lipoprotein A